MYGKHFASTYTGSMFGAGLGVFAVWGYVIANTVASQVELNPTMLAAILGTDVATVEKAIEFLCAPDRKSRSKNDDGRRLVREGEFAYRVPNHDAYRKIAHEDDRRQYNRIKKAEGRAHGVNTRVKLCQRESAVSAQAEAEAVSEAKAKEEEAGEGPTTAAVLVTGGKVGKPGTKKIISAYGIPTFPENVDEWRGGLNRVARVKSETEAHEFLGWADAVVRKDGGSLKYFREIRQLAEEWDRDQHKEARA